MEPSDESLALLARMSAKPGVQATLILSRADGAILRADNIASLKKQHNSNKNTAGGTGDRRPHADSLPEQTTRSYTMADTNGDVAAADADENKRVRQDGEDVARIVWRFIKATESAVEDLDSEDEVRLLRVRTKRNEIVIVPSSKFLLVVVHDTPPA